MKIPYISKTQLEQQAFDLYQRALMNGDTEPLPINVENIVEFTLKYNLNLGASLPPHVLGASDWESKMVQISESVTHNGRRRFTIAHEIAHIVLHFPLLEAHNEQVPLFFRDEVIFQDKDSEWQANYFGGALLMPAELMIKYFGTSARYGKHINVQEVVDTFCVSKIAAQKRLETLKMILTQQPGVPLNFES